MVLKFLKAALLLLLLGAPALSWGFSLERNEFYKRQILEKHLAESPAWLRLGHYHRSWLGGFHSKIKGDFFLSSRGADSPEEELLTSVDVLFSEKSLPVPNRPGQFVAPQCRYLARMDWLKKNLDIDKNDLVSCPAQDEWKQRLGAEQASVIFASSDLSSPGSSFGHTFLRLHSPEHTGALELLDYGVNFAAVTGTDTGALIVLKGLFGGYPGAYSLQPYHQKIREYANLEGRDLWEYHLRLNADEVHLMVDHLLELDGSFVDYYFLNQNCSYQLMELLEVARPDLDLTSHDQDVAIPLDTLKQLGQAKLLEDEKVRMSLQSEWRARYERMDFAQKKSLRELLRAPENKEWTQNLSSKEKAEVLEGALAELAVQEYRDQKEYKEEKYKLAVERAQLGMITEPLILPPPPSPLLSSDSMAFNLGYGADQNLPFYDFKFRRAFHDLLSPDAGISPFSHLEVLGLDFHTYIDKRSVVLDHATLLKVLSTSPVTALESPLSWSLDIGLQPVGSPYANVGAGRSFDVPWGIGGRWVFMGRLENVWQDSRYEAFLGPQALWVQKWNERFRTLIENNYLYSSNDKKPIWEQNAGLSFSIGRTELRAEILRKACEETWMLYWML